MNSIVRKHVLADDAAAASPRNSGPWAIMAQEPGSGGRIYFNLTEANCEVAWVVPGALVELTLFEMGGTKT